MKQFLDDGKDKRISYNFYIYHFTQFSLEDKIRKIEQQRQIRIGIYKSLVEKNKILVNEWIWRYKKERESLWRRVIIEKNGGEPTRLIPNTLCNRTTFTMWKNIVSPFTSSDPILDMVKVGIRMVAKTGEHILFWHNKQIGYLVLL
ncbi:Uncharacterized protein TCM_014076 [Theobroma cacao]|uniref:Uncharacterized protein n=1 Tax=Theobroma cacao TaxID=3641 RepID=A0A061FXA1_THECC|nr:Uncharacterized protein TCM_014076 [Theobroma cacao]